MMAANAIHVRGLTVVHPTASGPLRALDCPILDVAGGSSLAIVGASGSGKSTLLGVLAGLAQPTSGSISLGPTEVTALSEPARAAWRKRAIGMVYQADNLLPFLTASENIRLQLALCGDVEDAAARTAGLLESLGMAALGARLPDQLSGGQRQRVAVARAIVHRPSVILADEPTGALDTQNAAAVIALLRAAQQSIGATLVVVTHDATTANSMARRVTLRQGKIVTDSEVDHVH